jgi:ketol-acid reductoisomerase
VERVDLAQALVRLGFETLVEAGYQPEIAYYECLHELKLIVDLMYEVGLSGMRFSMSDTAEYGDLTRGPQVIDAGVRENMRKVLSDIRESSFAQDWIEQMKAGGAAPKGAAGEGGGAADRAGRARAAQPDAPGPTARRGCVGSSR